VFAQTTPARSLLTINLRLRYLAHVFKPLLTVALLLLALSLPAAECKHRGVWFWQDIGNPYGAANIVGNAVLENQTVTFLTSKSVKRVYGSYGTQPVTSPSVSAAWNTKLNAVGIQSQFLLSETTSIFPSNHPALLTKIDQRGLNFNSAPGRTGPEKFDALHLDIEPQALPNWSALTSSEKRDHLLLLRDTYAVIRTHLISQGVPTFPVYADLPVWFDRLPTDGGQIGWTNAADRNQWFTNIAASLTGYTLMAFDQSSFTAITNNVAWELTNGINTQVRVAIEADVGATNTWADLPAFNAMLETLETNYGPTRAVDIQSYVKWREAITAGPVIPVAVAFSLARPLIGGDILFENDTVSTYIVLHSFNLCHWQEILRVKSQQAGPLAVPIRFDNSQGFWRIERFAEP
jgi:hypothetical protein